MQQPLDLDLTTAKAHTDASGFQLLLRNRHLHKHDRQALLTEMHRRNIDSESVPPGLPSYGLPIFAQPPVLHALVAWIGLACCLLLPPVKAIAIVICTATAARELGRGHTASSRKIWYFLLSSWIIGSFAAFALLD